MARKWFALLLAATLAFGFLSARAEGSGAFSVDLSQGMSGEDVARLQALLLRYGFSTSEADGRYGDGTVAAVKSLENYLNTLYEYELALSEAARMPDAPTPAPSPDGEGETAEPSPEVTPEITPAPAAYAASVGGLPFETDGVAEVRLLRLLESGCADFYVGDVEPIVHNEDARRAQNRLIALNYLTDTADGSFGENSMAAMRAFQRDNGLPVTGLPNGADTRTLLYDSDAEPALRPVYNMLVASDTESDQVMSIQKALSTYGFTIETPDGLYGANTEDMLTAFKSYLMSAGLIDENGELGGDASGVSLVSETGARHELQNYLLNGGFDCYRLDLSSGVDAPEDVMRVQRRLYVMGYLFIERRIDGDYGTITEEAVRDFQARNGLSATGIADEMTQRAMFSESAVKVLKPYLIKVSTADQRVYVFTPDEFENYTVLDRTFVCSTGKDETPTPLGTFEYTGRGERWHFFTEFHSWAQYAFHIDGGIMFHSVIYDKKEDESSLQVSTLTGLGYKASHGCIRLAVDDAKWIWENCPTRTTVIIY